MDKVKQLSKVQKIIISVIAVILVLVIAGGAFCISTNQSPVAAIQSISSKKDDKIVGKWQKADAKGVIALVFYNDGTYDSYILTANISGEYNIDGNKLTLHSPSTAKDIVYKFSVNDKELKLTLLEEDGAVPEEKEESIYEKVDELNQSSFADLLGQLAEDKENTEE